MAIVATGWEQTSRSIWRGAAFGGCIALICGCATLGGSADNPSRANLQRGDEIGSCARLYRDVDRAVARAGVRDAQSAPVAGFPYLRTNRFLAHRAGPDPEQDSFQAWVKRLRRLDIQARRAELANLPEAFLEARWPEELERCATLLQRHDLREAAARARLAATGVPDSYRLAFRVFGLYPLASVPFLSGVRRLHRDTARTFATPLETLPVAGTLRRFSPAASTVTLSRRQVADLLTRASANPLRVPDPDPADLERLFERFAPIWEVDVSTADDRPGRPRVRAGRAPKVDGPTTVFTLATHTRWQGQTLLQLSYVIWFPARPRSGRFDLVGGHMDGITWRVTLGADGMPLIYDSMHNCGCYYHAFPTPRVALEQPGRGWEEPISVPQTVTDGRGRLVIRIAAGSHYLQRVLRQASAGTTARPETVYHLAPYDALRSLPLPGGGHRSLFQPDGMVAGTERPERWLFWPMGVPKPGAMRQWGHHAIAFVGRRHFDDPQLLERYFNPATAPPRH